MASLTPRYSQCSLFASTLLVLFGVPAPVEAASTINYPQSAFFDVVSGQLSTFVDISEVGGLVIPLVSDADDNTSGLVESLAEIDENTAPALPAGRTPAGPNQTAFGLARTEDTLENMAVASGVFSGNIGDRIEIVAGSSQTFTLEFNQGTDLAESTAVICLMPIRLAIFEGTVGAAPSTATYSYSLVLDGNTIFESSMRLTGTASNQQLTTVRGLQRSDGVFFSDPANRAFGVDFPALTVTAEMGAFAAGGTRDGQIEFTARIEAPDSNWGAYAAPNLAGGTNLFIPIPEPQLSGLLVAGLLLMLCRRGR